MARVSALQFPVQHGHSSGLVARVEVTDPVPEDDDAIADGLARDSERFRLQRSPLVEALDGAGSLL